MEILTFLISFTFLSLVVASSLDPEMVKKIHGECFEISHLPRDSLDKIRAGQVDLTDLAVKEHLFCYTKKVGFVNDAGILNDDLIKKRLALQIKDENKVEEYAKICNAPKKEGEEVNYFAAKVVACYYNSFPGIVIM
uniref:Odorant binding protein 11 n=3 Tax=Harmonia axyridis TaxID=115357 RepID=A0A8J9R3F9_HARAX|nr:odorant binding protein 11 [Harmonia axyridis]